MPLIYDSGYNLASGRKHKITFTKKTQYRAGAPYTPCNDSVPNLLKAIYGQVPDADYDYDEYNCFYTCTQKYVWVSFWATMFQQNQS